MLLKNLYYAFASRPDRSHLNRSGITPIYFVSGDEPLQKIECIDTIRSHARKQGYVERVVLNVDKNFSWDSIAQETGNLSLFSSRKIIELRMLAPKPGKEGGRVLSDYAEQVNDDNLLIISSDKIDKNSLSNKWVKAIEQAGVLIQVWPVNPSQLPAWIQTRIQSKQKKISMDAARLIAQKVEGNLLAARQEIDKLDLLVNKEVIEIEDVVGSVADNTRYDVFDMIESAYLGNPDRALQMLNGLRNEGTEPIALFGAIMWEFRRSCAMASQLESGTNLDKIFGAYRIWENKKRPLNAFLKRHTLSNLQKTLNYCAEIDKTLKTGRKEQAWDQLNILLLTIAGINTDKLQAA